MSAMRTQTWKPVSVLWQEWKSRLISMVLQSHTPTWKTISKADKETFAVKSFSFFYPMAPSTLGKLARAQRVRACVKCQLPDIFLFVFVAHNAGDSCATFWRRLNTSNYEIFKNGLFECNFSKSPNNDTRLAREFPVSNSLKTLF